MTFQIKFLFPLSLLMASVFSHQAEAATACDRLVALYIELAKKSGQSVSEASARREVLSENPTEAECVAMLALFQAHK